MKGIGYTVIGLVMIGILCFILNANLQNEMKTNYCKTFGYNKYQARFGLFNWEWECYKYVEKSIGGFKKETSWPIYNEKWKEIKHNYKNVAEKKE